MSFKHSQLPRILCLHGEGTSELILSFQTRKLTKALRNDFRFVFIDAPLECSPGPGVLPVFQDAGPYYQWIAENEQDEERVRTTLEQALKKEGGAPFVGVLGFSQGARVAAGLLHEAQERVGAPQLSFGILINGSYPALRQSSNPSPALPRLTESHRRDWKDEHEGCIHLPSIHVHGKRDDALERSRLLARCFDPKTATVMEFDNGHHLPVSDDDTKEIADGVLRIYRNGPLKKD